jgi:hypothetical protein
MPIGCQGIPTTSPRFGGGILRSRQAGSAGIFAIPGGVAQLYCANDIAERINELRANRSGREQGGSDPVAASQPWGSGD